MKLTPHEKKILSLIENDPDIINDTKKRAKIAKDNGLSEKTLRNRIGDLKKYGVISIDRNKNQSDDKKIVLNEGIKDNIIDDPISLIKKERKLLITFQGDPHNEHQLPGGGVDVGESHLQTLHREALEETGWIISPKRRLGAFQRFTYMPEYNLWARKVCHIYFCKAVMSKTKPLHDDHSPLWINPQSALNMLYNSGDKHFVALAINLGYFKDIK